MISDTYRPKSQSECDHANALREYESAHKPWMNANVFTDAGRDAQRRLCVARETLNKAVKAAHPSWIVM